MIISHASPQGWGKAGKRSDFFMRYGLLPPPARHGNVNSKP
jgi:hypothetical protein